MSTIGVSAMASIERSAGKVRLYVGTSSESITPTYARRLAAQLMYAADAAEQMACAEADDIVLAGGGEIEEDDDESVSAADVCDAEASQ